MADLSQPVVPSSSAAPLRLTIRTTSGLLLNTLLHDDLGDTNLASFEVEQEALATTVGKGTLLTETFSAARVVGFDEYLASRGLVSGDATFAFRAMTTSYKRVAGAVSAPRPDSLGVTTSAPIKTRLQLTLSSSPSTTKLGLDAASITQPASTSSSLAPVTVRVTVSNAAELASLLDSDLSSSLYGHASVELLRRPAVTEAGYEVVDNMSDSRVGDLDATLSPKPSVSASASISFGTLTSSYKTFSPTGHPLAARTTPRVSEQTSPTVRLSVSLSDKRSIDGVTRIEIVQAGAISSTPAPFQVLVRSTSAASLNLLAEADVGNESFAAVKIDFRRPAFRSEPGFELLVTCEKATVAGFDEQLTTRRQRVTGAVTFLMQAVTSSYQVLHAAAAGTGRGPNSPERATNRPSFTGSTGLLLTLPHAKPIALGTAEISQALSGSATPASFTVTIGLSSFQVLDTLLEDDLDGKVLGRVGVELLHHLSPTTAQRISDTLTNANVVSFAEGQAAEGLPTSDSVTFSFGAIGFSEGTIKTGAASSAPPLPRVPDHSEGSAQTDLLLMLPHAQPVALTSAEISQPPPSASGPSPFTVTVGTSSPKLLSTLLADDGAGAALATVVVDLKKVFTGAPGFELSETLSGASVSSFEADLSPSAPGVSGSATFGFSSLSTTYRSLPPAVERAPDGIARASTFEVRLSLAGSAPQAVPSARIFQQGSTLYASVDTGSIPLLDSALSDEAVGKDLAPLELQLVASGEAAPVFDETFSGAFASALDETFTSGAPLTGTATFRVTLAPPPPWTLVTIPSPAAQSYLTSVSCTQGPFCMAVGYYPDSSGLDVPWAMSWDGSRWSNLTINPPTGSTFADLEGVSCPSSTSCTAVGGWENASSFGLLYAEQWDGSSWSVQSVPAPAAAAESFLTGVSCTSSSACEAVGWSLDEPGPLDDTLAEAWNGTSWSIGASANPSSSSTLASVSCTTSVCTAVGESDNSTLAESEAGGGAFTVISTPNPAGAAQAYLESVSCSGSGACTAVGASQNSAGDTATLAEGFDGTTWTTEPTPSQPGDDAAGLQGLDCLTSSSCEAAGGAGPTSASTAPLAMGSTGTTWEVQGTQDVSGGSSEYLASLSCPSASRCVTVGDETDAAGNVGFVEEASFG